MTLMNKIFQLILPSDFGNEVYMENPFNLGMYYMLKVSLKIGLFSDFRHTHPGI